MLDYWKKVAEAARTEDQRAMIEMTSKYKCVICGNNEISFTERQKFAGFYNPTGIFVREAGLDEHMIVCSEECRRRYVRDGNIPYPMLMRGVGIPPRYKYVRLEQWKMPGTMPSYDAIQKWLADDKREGIYMYGPPGTGKTHMACCLAHELRKREERVKYMRASLLACIANTSTNSTDRVELLDHFTEYNIIILDDFAKHHLTAIAREMMFQLLANAYEMEQTVILTSNYYPKQIADAIDERLESRLTEMCAAMTFDMEDKRHNGDGSNTGK